MFGVHLFRRSTFSIDCDACGRRFDLSTGGVCSRCQRILCFEHLHGSWLRRAATEVGAKRVCVSCRAGQPPATDRR